MIEFEYVEHFYSLDAIESMKHFHCCLIFVISWSSDWRWQSQKAYVNSNLIIYWTNVSDCHCIACNIIEITYKSKYNLIAQMFLVMIDLDTFRLVDQSKVLILFVLIFQSSVIVLSNNNANKRDHDELKFWHSIYWIVV